MIISPQSLDTNLSQLLAEVKSGSMQLPEFQRDLKMSNLVDTFLTRLHVMPHSLLRHSIFVF